MRATALTLIDAVRTRRQPRRVTS